MHGRFENSFRGEIAGPRHWRLTRKLCYIAPDGQQIDVPADEVTDGASVPRKMLATGILLAGGVLTAVVFATDGIGWYFVAGFFAAATLAIWRLPYREQEMAAAAVHDWLYRRRERLHVSHWRRNFCWCLKRFVKTKLHADWCFYHALRASGLAFDQAWWYWFAVAFSLTAWRGFKWPRLKGVTP